MLLLLQLMIPVGFVGPNYLTKSAIDNKVVCTIGLSFEDIAAVDNWFDSCS